MKNLVTIATFTIPSELLVIKARLESEGIECFVKDEITAQVNNFYSNAIGGVKLQVKIKDEFIAKEILTTSGYLYEIESNSPKSIDKIIAITSKIPLLNKLGFLPRLLIIATLFSLIIAIPIVVASLPSKYELLRNNFWCVSHISYQGENYRPKTINPTDGEIFVDINIEEPCEENVTLWTSGYFGFPGFQSKRINGKWEFVNNQLIISRLDTFNFLIEGSYTLDFSKNKLTLISKNTTIHCYKSRY